MLFRSIFVPVEPERLEVWEPGQHGSDQIAAVLEGVMVPVVEVTDVYVPDSVGKVVRSELSQEQRRRAKGQERETTDLTSRARSGLSATRRTRCSSP